MKLLLIVNPAASAVTARRRIGVQDQLSRHHRLEVAETSQRGHATELARNAVRDELDAVVVLGGDGTLNETADGLAGTQTALAPLPGGSTNVFARSIGVHKKLQRGVEQLVDALDRKRFRRIGLGTGNGRRFLFHLGAGFDARVIERVERHPWLQRSRFKRWLAHPAFTVAASTTFFRKFDRTEAPFRVELPDGSSLGDGFFAIVSNTAPYTYFGPRPLIVTGAADLDRSLALTMFRRLDLATLGPASASAIRHGRRLERHEAIAQHADLDQLTLVANRGAFPWQVDGDYLGETERIEIRHDPATLSVLLPQAP